MPSTNNQLETYAQLDDWVYDPTTAPLPNNVRVLTDFTNVNTDTFAELVGQTDSSGHVVSVTLVFRGTQIADASSHWLSTLADVGNDIKIMAGQAHEGALQAAEAIAGQAAKWLHDNSASVNGHQTIDSTTGQSLGGGLALAASLQLHENNPTWATKAVTFAAINADTSLSSDFTQSEIIAASSFTTNYMFSSDNVTGPASLAGGSTIGTQVVLPSIGPPPNQQAENPDLAGWPYGLGDYWAALQTLPWHVPEAFVSYFAHQPQYNDFSDPTGQFLFQLEYAAALIPGVGVSISPDGSSVTEAYAVPGLNESASETSTANGIGSFGIWVGGTLRQAAAIDWTSGIPGVSSAAAGITLNDWLGFTYTGTNAAWTIGTDGQLTAELGSPSTFGLDRSIAFDTSGNMTVQVGGVSLLSGLPAADSVVVTPGAISIAGGEGGWWEGASIGGANAALGYQSPDGGTGFWTTDNPAGGGITVVSAKLDGSVMATGQDFTNFLTTARSATRTKTPAPRRTPHAARRSRSRPANSASSASSRKCSLLTTLSGIRRPPRRVANAQDTDLVEGNAIADDVGVRSDQLAHFRLRNRPAAMREIRQAVPGFDQRRRYIPGRQWIGVG